MTAVKPIRVLNTYDERFIDTENVLTNYPSVFNIATMPWRDFEHMIATLFHKIFESFGGEVHLTRSSGDRGVDAIGFDPDPIRGGKVVIQAKHYPGRLVSPSNVRELLGSMTAEGATKGYLVTTGYFSSESRSFAADHNIVLFDGQELLDTLHKYGFTKTSYQI